MKETPAKAQPTTKKPAEDPKASLQGQLLTAALTGRAPHLPLSAADARRLARHGISLLENKHAVQAMLAAEMAVGIVPGFRNRGGKAIAPAGHGFDYGLAAVANRFADFADALRQCFIGDNYVGPDRPEKLVLGDEPARIFDQATQDLETLWPQLDLAIRGPQTSASDIKHITVELEHGTRAVDEVNSGNSEPI